jgi:hypothetical protein
VTVYEAWALVMADVQAIRKEDRNEQQRYLFRGIDAVLLAVGPALRKHQVTVIPTATAVETERYTTAKGGQMQGVIVRMVYTVYGPEGDSFVGAAYGQAADAGDKAVAKAEAVAYRTFLLQSLTVPTDDPDPDAATHERAKGEGGEAPKRTMRRKAAPKSNDPGRPPAGAASISKPSKPEPEEPPLTTPGPYEATPHEALREHTRKHMFALLADLGIDDPVQQRAGMERILRRTVQSRASLTEEEGQAIVEDLRARKRARDGDEGFPRDEEPPQEEG